MAKDFDNFPIYDQITKDKSPYLSNVWLSFMANFIESLQGYLTQGGILAPHLTTSQRDALINVTNGQIIYNTTLNKFQGYEGNIWQNLI